MFQLLRNIQSILMSPPDAPTGVADKPSGDLSKNDILDYLNQDDKEDEIPLDDDKDKDDKKTEKKETKDDEESDEDDKEDTEEDEDKSDLDLLEEELVEPDEDKLELTTPISRREILKKYPKLFKEFPALEKSYYREQAFTQLLPTIADAKEAVDKSQTLDKFETDLSNGNTEVVLNAIKASNPKAFNKVVDNYLQVLSKVDEKAYQHVLGNTIKHTILAMLEESRNSDNAPLEQAAQILNQFIFGSSKFTAPTKLSSDEDTKGDDEEKKMSERERNFTRQKFNSANDEISTKITKAYKATIESKIDPKESMTEYVRKTAIRDAAEELESLIEKDTRFKSLIDKLWENAFKDDFSQASLAKIRSAFVSKAQTLLPSVIAKHRNAALKGMGKRTSNINDKDDDSHQDKESKRDNDSRPRRESKRDDESRRRNDSGNKGKVPAGMSTLEYLMSED